MPAGMNCPVRIGQATVMPGDVVLGRDDGVIFIPPHLAEQVVKTSELIRLRDLFGKQRLGFVFTQPPPAPVGYAA